MSNINNINSIPFLEFLSALWFTSSDYQLKWDVIKMKDKGVVTDWWTGSVDKGFLKCHSWDKGSRIEGDRISLVKQKFSFNTAEAISWCEEKFNLEKKSVVKKNTIADKWGTLPDITDKQKQFLREREIAVMWPYCKDNNWKLSVAIKSENWLVNALQCRSINPNDSIRYSIDKWENDSSGLFFDSLDSEKKILFVVEWFTDFLTLRQLTTNVVGLVSALSWLELLRAFERKYDIIYIPDNDDAWDKSLNKLRDLWIRFGYYDIKTFWEEELKDVNDLYVYCKQIGISDDWFLEMLSTESEKPIKNIDLALKKAIKNRDVWSWEISSPIFNEATWGITPWSVTILNWLSWEWKTTTLDWIISDLIELHNKKIAFCSIDDDIGKMLAMFLWRTFLKEWRTEIYPEIENYIKQYWVEKFDNFLLFDTVNTLDWFWDLVEEENIDVLVIDYIQVIEWLRWEMKEQMLKAIRGLQRLAIEKHCAIICLSQVSKWESQIPVINRTPMESQYIKSASDTFINIWVFNWEHKIWFVKNKYWSNDFKNKEFDTAWDRKTGKISIAYPLWQERKEGKDYWGL